MTRRRARAAAAPAPAAPAPAGPASDATASPATADSGAAGTVESATGTLYVPTTGAAGAAPKTDVRIVPVAAVAPGGSAPTLQRRRLAAAPTRFPSLGPSGDVVEADPVDSGSRREATGRRPAPLFPEPSQQELPETSTITTSRRGRRPAPAGATPATGVPALPVVSGPATGEFGSGGLALPGLAPGLPAAAAGTAGALGAAAGGLLGGHATAPAAGAAAAGAAGAGTLDVIAGPRPCRPSGPAAGPRTLPGPLHAPDAAAGGGRRRRRPAHLDHRCRTGA